jgi:hypothetical protein
MFDRPLDMQVDRRLEHSCWGGLLENREKDLEAGCLKPPRLQAEAVPRHSGHMRNIIGVDAQFAYHFLKRQGLRTDFPYLGLRDLVEEGGDQVLDIFAPVIRMTPVDSSPEAIAKASQDFHRVRRALESQGVNVIEAPSKPSGIGVKHSDDQRLMIRLALVCTRLKPDFLVLVATDGDYAPLVWGLREEGIRTKLISDPHNLASELRAAAYSVSSLNSVLDRLAEAGR